MALGFMGLLGAVIGDRVGRRPAHLLLGPLLLVGLGSVLDWQAMERLGGGNLH